MSISKIFADKNKYSFGDTVNVKVSTDRAGTRVCVFPDNVDPESDGCCLWTKPTPDDGALSFGTDIFNKAGRYHIFLIKDSDSYISLASCEIFMLDKDDEADYGIKNAEISSVRNDGILHTEIKITAADKNSHSYLFYWCKGEERLADYTPLFKNSKEGDFTVVLNESVYMPDEADTIEISVAEGHSKPYYLKAPETMYLPKSKLRYKLQILTDIHVARVPNHQSLHFIECLMDIAELVPDSVAIMTAGDNTNDGMESEYDHINAIIDEFRDKIPPIFFSMGNHDIVYTGTFDEQKERFCRRLGMPGPFYSVEKGGARIIILSSDVQHSNGYIKEKRRAWLRRELENFGKDEPIFIAVHQAFKDTVSGALSYINPRIQCWYGLTDDVDELRAMFKEYPNIFHFTGHGHWSLESLQPLLCGRGKDANFANAGCVGYLQNDLDQVDPGSEGYFAEVYDDYVLLRGREFAYKKWCSVAQFCVPIYR